MKAFLRFVGPAALACVLAPGVELAQCKVVKIKLPEMVQKANLIMIGQTVSIVPSTTTGTNSQAQEHTNTDVVIQVDTVVKGGARTGKVLVKYNSLRSPRPEFVLGQQSLVFLSCTDSECRVVQKYAGNLPIIDGWLVNIYMLEEEERQPLTTFLDKIRSITLIP